VEVKRVSKVVSFVGRRYRCTFNFFFLENAPGRETYIHRRLTDSEPFVLHVRLGIVTSNKTSTPKRDTCRLATMVTKTFIDLPSGIKCLEIVEGGDVWPLSNLLDMGRERVHTDTIFQDCIAEVSTWPAGQPVEQVTLAMQPRQSSVLSIQEYLQIPGSKRIANYHPKEGAIKLDLVKVFRWKEGLRNWYDEKTMERDPFEQAEAVMVWSCYVSVEPGKQLRTDAERKLLAILSLRLNRNLNEFIAICKAELPSDLADRANYASSAHRDDDSTGVASENAAPELPSSAMAGVSELSEASRLDLTQSPASVSTDDSRSARMSPLALTFSTAGSQQSNTSKFSTSPQDEDRNSLDQPFGVISVIRMPPPVLSTKTGSTTSPLDHLSDLISLLSFPKLRRRKHD
jgi:hypothetical protein